jgi:hypothetical protein
MTWTFQGWILLPLGAYEATESMSLTVFIGTGVGRKPRTLRRVRIASSTNSWAAFMTPFLRKVERPVR